uniref:F-box domain-containing protein n=1 Tax=Strongyloides stercoralis TaxID=6248 RepID=A0A0K0EQE3_STRER
MSDECSIMDILNNKYFAKNLSSYILSINDLDNLSFTCKAAYGNLSLYKSKLVLKKRKFCTTLIVNDNERQRQIIGTGRIRNIFLNEESLEIEKNFYKSLLPDEIDMIDEVHFRIEDRRQIFLTRKYDDYAPKIAKIIDNYFEMFPNAKILNFMDSFNNYPSGFPLAVVRYLRSPKIEVITNISIPSIIKYYSNTSAKNNDYFINLKNLKEFGFCIHKREYRNLTYNEMVQFEPFVEYLSNNSHIIYTFYKTIFIYHTPINKTILEMLLKYKLNIKIDHRLSWYYLSILNNLTTNYFVDFTNIQHFNFTYLPYNGLNKVLPMLQHLNSMIFYFPSGIYKFPLPPVNEETNTGNVQDEWPLDNLRNCCSLKEVCIAFENSIQKTLEFTCLSSSSNIPIQYLIENLPQSVTKLTIISNEELTTKLANTISHLLPNLKELTLWNMEINNYGILDEFKSLEFLHLNMPINFNIPTSVKYLIVEHEIERCKCLNIETKPYRHDLENKELFSKYTYFMLITQDHNTPIKVFFKNVNERNRYQEEIRTFRERIDLFSLPI